MKQEACGITILYIEDEPETRDIVLRSLAGRYPDVCFYAAEDGRTGLSQFIERQPDIVVTDIRLPGMDGISMSREIKAHNRGTLIIALTACSDTELLLQAIELGFNHFVLKSLDCSKLFDAVDTCIGQIVLNRTVAEQFEHISKLSRAVTASPCAVVITNALGTIEYVNPKFCEITGYSAEEAFGKNPRILKSDRNSAEIYVQLWRTITAGNEWRGEFQNRKKSGELYWESASISPIFDAQGKISHFVAVKEDISLRKRAEEDIEILNTHLAARAGELESANCELEAFGYTVSHDLRKPLTIINGYSQIILDLFGGSLPDQPKEFLKVILRESLKMNQLIETLLNFSRVTRSELNLQRFDLSELACGIAAEFSMLEPERKVSVSIAEGLEASGDTRLLRVALANLIGNAWKFTRKCENALIEFGRSENEGGQTYYVRDNGAGFDQSGVDGLFTPFRRLHDDGEFEGVGIGLATVRRIIERHGGKVWADGVPGKGAVFYFTL
jgi:PAS domain S-box-containing protein